MPVVFLTAYYGLVDLAGLQAGEWVLVHAGAGGVGMAAVQIARHLGAEVFATASPAKWEALREARPRRATTSPPRATSTSGTRSSTATGGEGVDVVLNSLAGEFVDASLRLLPRGGRFLEMGKTDIRDPERVAAEHPGVAYRAVRPRRGGPPSRIGEMLAELIALFERAAARPACRQRAGTCAARPEAFRYLRQARHVGKVVLTIPRAARPRAARC